MYQAMTSLGFAADSDYRGPLQLSGAPSGATVLVLGAGIAGLVAAYELRKAGYQVQVLEYNSRAGGRNWTLRGGDRYTELGRIHAGMPIRPGSLHQPGPVALPYHHRGMLSYCKLLGVQLEPFVQVQLQRFSSPHQGVRRQAAALPHHQGGLPRSRRGASRKGPCRARISTPAVTVEDQERLLASLREWGALDDKYRYARAIEQRPARLREGSRRRARRRARCSPSRCSCRRAAIRPVARPIAWRRATTCRPPCSSPSAAWAWSARRSRRELGAVDPLQRQGRRIRQDEPAWPPPSRIPRRVRWPQTARADWCVCTIPLSISDRSR